LHIFLKVKVFKVNMRFKLQAGTKPIPSIIVTSERLGDGSILGLNELVIYKRL